MIHVLSLSSLELLVGWLGGWVAEWVAERGGGGGWFLSSWRFLVILCSSMSSFFFFFLNFETQFWWFLSALTVFRAIFNDPFVTFEDSGMFWKVSRGSSDAFRWCLADYSGVRAVAWSYSNTRRQFLLPFLRFFIDSLRIFFFFFFFFLFFFFLNCYIVIIFFFEIFLFLHFPITFEYIDPVQGILEYTGDYFSIIQRISTISRAFPGNFWSFSIILWTTSKIM